LNQSVPSPTKSAGSIGSRLAGWLLSWGLPLACGLVYFAAYYPGFTNHDSQSIWLNAFQYVRDPDTIPLMNWYSVLLAAARIAALRSGLGVPGYHAVFCLLTYGSWALLVASLMRSPWKRGLTHLLLLLPFIGANLAFQVPDVWAAVGLAWMVIGLHLGRAEPKPRAWWSAVLYFLGALVVFGARLNAALALPVFAAVPLLFRVHRTPAVRWASVAAPVAALVLVLAANAALPVRDQYKLETYMAFETIGIWKAGLASHPGGVPAGVEPPRVFRMMPQEPAFYLARWNGNNVDQIIWDLPEFKDKQVFIAPNAARIRQDYFRTIGRFPLQFVKMKLSFGRNGLGLAPADALPVSTPAPDDWIDQLGIPLHHRPLWPAMSRALLGFISRTQLYWQPLMLPVAWCILCLAVFAWRQEQGRVASFDYAWLVLLGGYYATILFFAPIYLPRYVIPVWVVLGAGTVRLLLVPDAEPAGPGAAGAAVRR